MKWLQWGTNIHRGLIDSTTFGVNFERESMIFTSKSILLVRRSTIALFQGRLESRRSDFIFKPIATSDQRPLMGPNDSPGPIKESLGTTASAVTQQAVSNLTRSSIVTLPATETEVLK